MEMIMTAVALAAGSQAAPVQAPAAQPMNHAQHDQVNGKEDAKACPCCEKMADGKKMACCEKHERADADAHAGHAGHNGQ